MDVRKNPLDAYPIISTTSVARAEEFVGKNLGAILEFPHASHRIDLVANRFMLEQSDIWFCSYGEPVTLAFPEGDNYRFQFQYRGAGATLAGNQELSVTAEQSVITPPIPIHIKFGRDFQQTILRVSSVALLQKIAALTGVGTMTGAPEFKSVLKTKTEKYSIFKNVLDFMTQTFSNTETKLPGPLLQELEQALITSLLFNCENSYSDELLKEPAKPAPWQVCLVEQYIEANWDRAIKIEDIVSISGCSARSIFRTFKNSRGYSPMNFVKQVRLTRARELLSKPDTSTTITSVAYICGFGDLGRFSRNYAEAFHELPSQTLKRSKN